MIRTARGLTPILLAGALCVAAVPTALAAAARSPQARAAGSCSIGSGRGYGYSYLTSLRVSSTSCRTGRTVAKRHGHIRGWSCRRKTLDTSPVQYDARVTCHSGRRTVVWTYTQNT